MCEDDRKRNERLSRGKRYRRVGATPVFEAVLQDARPAAIGAGVAAVVRNDVHAEFDLKERLQLAVVEDVAVHVAVLHDCVHVQLRGSR